MMKMVALCSSFPDSFQLTHALDTPPRKRFFDRVFIRPTTFMHTTDNIHFISQFETISHFLSPREPPPSMLLDRTDEEDNINLPNSTTHRSLCSNASMTNCTYSCPSSWLQWDNSRSYRFVTSCISDVILNSNINLIKENKSRATSFKRIFAIIRGFRRPWNFAMIGCQNAQLTFVY